MLGRNDDGTHVLDAADVLSGDADIDFGDWYAGLLGGCLHCLLDGTRGVLDVFDHAALDAFRGGLAEANDFDFVVLGTLTDEAGDFGCSDVESDYNVILVVHNMYILMFESFVY